MGSLMNSIGRGLARLIGRKSEKNRNASVENANKVVTEAKEVRNKKSSMINAGKPVFNIHGTPPDIYGRQYRPNQKKIRKAIRNNPSLITKLS